MRGLRKFLPAFRRSDSRSRAQLLRGEQTEREAVCRASPFGDRRFDQVTHSEGGGRLSSTSPDLARGFSPSLADAGFVSG
jgi:hypothetical protein